MTKELTTETVENLLSQLPDELEQGALSALLLTLADRYTGPDGREALSLLLTSSIIYGRTIGLPNEKIASILRAAAEQVSQGNYIKKVH